MGLRIRKTIKLFPGVKINIGKKGISASIGRRGATLNINKHGARTTIGVPGTGISYSQELLKWKDENPTLQELYQPEQQADGLTTQLETIQPMSCIDIDHLTSDALKPLKNLIMASCEKRGVILSNLLSRREIVSKQRDELQRKQHSLFKFFYKKRIIILLNELSILSSEIEQLEASERQTYIKIDDENSSTLRIGYHPLKDAFNNIIKSSSIWNITAEKVTHTIEERKTAKREVKREKVNFTFSNHHFLLFEEGVMTLENTNGYTLFIYPKMAVITNKEDMLALIDLCELDITYHESIFQESESLPTDAKVISYTWFKSDCSPPCRARLPTS